MTGHAVTQSTIVAAPKHMPAGSAVSATHSATCNWGVVALSGARARHYAWDDESGETKVSLGK